MRRINDRFRPLEPLASTAILLLAALGVAELVALVTYRLLFPSSFHFGALAATTGVTTLLVAAPLILLFVATIKNLDFSKEQYRRMRDRVSVESQAKSRFLANMSHELKTPLNAIIGFCQMMQRTVHGPLGSAKYAEYVDDIAASGSHLSALIDDILEVARAESGLRPSGEATFRLSPLIDEALAAMAREAKAKSILLEADLPEDLPQLYADRRQVRRMLLHLLANAVKFTPCGGWVVLAAHEAGKEGLRISVTDNGIGIAESDLPLVLQPFYQIAPVENRQAGGIGLGLPLVKAMIESHGGALRLQSVRGQGTRVALVFPPQRLRREPSDAVTPSPLPQPVEG